jgi:hypothetical protein
MRALLARTHGDEGGYREFRTRYGDMTTSLGVEGHMAMAEAMQERVAALMCDSGPRRARDP